MKGIKKKLLGMFLSLSMVFAIIPSMPMTAFAAGDPVFAETINASANTVEGTNFTVSGKAVNDEWEICSPYSYLTITSKDSSKNIGKLVLNNADVYTSGIFSASSLIGCDNATITYSGETLTISNLNVTSITIGYTDDGGNYLYPDSVSIYTVSHTCNLTAQSGQAATCTEDGWKDYYQCTGTDACGKIYATNRASGTSYADLAAWKASTAGKIAKLGHVWGYTANGATLTATCTRNSAHTATLTLSADTANYSGSAYTGASLGTTTSWTTAGLSEPVIKYVGRDGTTYSERTTAPTAVGTYTAKVTAGSATASVDFEITKANPTVTPPAATNPTYNGTAQALTGAGSTTTGTTIQFALGNDATTAPTEGWSTTIPTKTDAGTYYVWYKVVGNANYNDKDPACVTATVGKQSITVSGITAENKTYDKTTTATLNYTSAEFTGLLSGQQLAVEATGAFSNADVGINKTVNITGITLKDVEGSTYLKNYMLAASGQQTSTTATISKKEITKPAPENVTATYDGEHHIVTVAENEWYTITDNDKVNAGVYTTRVALKDKTNTCWNDAEKTNDDVTATLTINPKVTIYKKGDSKFVPIEAVNTTNAGTYALQEGTELAPGIYQVVTETGDKTVTTILNVVKDEAPTLSVHIPTKAVSSVVEVKPAAEGSKVTTPDVTVGGLDAYAETLDSGITVKLTAEAVAANSEDAVQTAIKEKNEAKGKNVLFYNFEIEKDVNGIPGGNVTDTGENLITIVIPFQTSGRTAFKVLRYHGGAAEVLTELKDNDPAAEGTYRVNTKAGTITIYASKFSTYAVAYSYVSSGSSNTITVPASVEHGKVTADKTKASSGEKVTLTVTPDKGYTLETLTVKDAKGNTVEVTKVNDTTYTFKMPGSKVTVEATFMEDNSMLNFFVDVPVNKYYYDAVLWAAENGITSGTDAVHFTPDGITTRAQVVTFLWRAAGCPEPKAMSSFSDVAAGSYYEKAVAWAVENGITKGTSATTFSPDAECTRGQIVTFLYRFNGVDTMNIKDNPFTDVAEGEFYSDAVLWAAENGVTSGTSATTFSPASNCLRGQVVTFLYRLLAE